MMLLDVTARYHPFEAFLYDSLVAPAVLETLLPFRDMVLATMKETSRILDVGCGGGQLAIEIARARPDLEVTGVDLSSSQLRRAKFRSAAAGARVDFIQASALDLPLPDASFDLVYSVDCLKHWPEKGRGLRECARLLRPGGMLFITEVNRDCTLRQGWNLVSKWRVPLPLRPFFVLPFFLFAAWRSLTVTEARTLAAPLGLEDLVVEPDPDGINWVMRGIKRRGVPEPLPYPMNQGEPPLVA